MAKIWSVYALVVREAGKEDVVFNVGMTERTLEGRMEHHRGNYNAWVNGKAREQGYYPRITEMLEANGETLWYRNLTNNSWPLRDTLPNVHIKLLQGKITDKEEAGVREEHWRQKYPTAMNVQPGGRGRGKKRKDSGGNSAKPFGCVSWHKARKKYRVLVYNVDSERYASGQKKQKHLGYFDTVAAAHEVLMKHWDTVKDHESLEGVLPPRTLEELRISLDERMFY